MPKHPPHTPQIESKPKVQLDTPVSMVAAPGTNAETLDTPEQPLESAYGKREWRSKQDGFLYAHCVFPHPSGKTHKGMIPRQGQVGDPNFHSGLFWEGTADEWDLNFRKE